MIMTTLNHDSLVDLLFRIFIDYNTLLTHCLFTSAMLAVAISCYRMSYNKIIASYLYIINNRYSAPVLPIAPINNNIVLSLWLSARYTIAIRPNLSIFHSYSTCIQVPRFSFLQKKISGLLRDRTHTLTSSE